MQKNKQNEAVFNLSGKDTTKLKKSVETLKKSGALDDKKDIIQVTEDNLVDKDAKSETHVEYLSNMRDEKPFVINGKKYEYVWAKYPDGSRDIGVYSFAGDLVYSYDWFNKNVLSKDKEPVKEYNTDFSGEELEVNDRENLVNYLNLTDLAGYKHFYVNINTGEVVNKFKNVKEMAKSGIKLGDNEDYMDVATLKKFRFGDYFKKNMNETDGEEMSGDVNTDKLRADVKKLINLITNKFGVYLSKLDKPVEQAEFLKTMAEKIGVPLNKLSSIISTYKDIAKSDTAVNENLILTKQELIESVINKKIIKFKDIK